jgi:hypothetical protein
MQLGTIVGLFVMAYALATGVWLAVLTARSSRAGLLLETMVQTSFLPEKRRRYLGFLSVEGGALLLVAIVWGLTQAGIVPDGISLLVTGGLVIVATTALGAVSWLGLRPSRLSASERRALAASAPEIFHHLFIAPLVQPDEVSGT